MSGRAAAGVPSGKLTARPDPLAGTADAGWSRRWAYPGKGVAEAVSDQRVAGPGRVRVRW
ncbi:hypothetical protein GCM10025331_72320 [Actinoplanes utahensis]|nr:hypothetical protein Aut01nite_68590 [Actinoplanes utahensis]